MNNKRPHIRAKRRFLQRHLQCLRENMTSFHLLTMFIGIACAFIGVYLINSRLSNTIAIFSFVLGVMLSLFGFVGSFGAYLEHTGFLNTYSSITAMLLLLEISLISFMYSYQHKLDDYASHVWDFFLRQDSRFLMDLEQVFQCCGYSSIQDRSVPKTCPVKMNVTIGCKPFVVGWIQEWHQWITIGIVTILTLQLILLIFSVIFGYAVDCKTREEESDMATLKSQIHHTAWLHNRSRYGSTGSTVSAY